MNEFPRRFGPYVLLKPLARGGMGALYLALSGPRGMAKLCVIKTVLPHLADKEYLQRFRDEAKVVVRLSHGNLVPVFDAGQVGGEIYLAMDYVEGKDLRAVWNRCAKKGVAFPVDVAVYIVKELCRGLRLRALFGDIKLVHRDVSPPNVLLSYSGEVKLTDFGLASSTLKLEKTAPGIIYGKVSYMSPEQARGEKLDGRTDLYAAGIILWELLTGRQLFPSGKAPGAAKDGTRPRSCCAACATPSSCRRRGARRACRPSSTHRAARRWRPSSSDRYADAARRCAHDLATFLAQTSPGDRLGARGDVPAASCTPRTSQRERAEREALIVKAREWYSTQHAAAPPRRRRDADGRRDRAAGAGEAARAATPAAAAPTTRLAMPTRPTRGDDRARRGDAVPRARPARRAPRRGRATARRDSQRRRPIDRRRRDAWSTAATVRRADRRGRHGPRLRGRAHRDRQARRAQGPAPGLQPDARSRRAVPARGARGVEDRAPEHRRRHRLGHDRRRRVLLRDGVPRGRSSSASSSTARARSTSARALHIGDADLPRAAGGARGRHHPPRPQARERLPPRRATGSRDFVKVLDFGIAKTHRRASRRARARSGG